MTSSQDYRPEIDGLRAIAVIAVIAFHMGLLPNGYLGVDVFFVISGYLITRLIRSELDSGQFNLLGFYLRRVRRIIPLTLVVSAVALLVGLYGMLPNDLKTLAQSVVATSLLSNNVLQAVTTRNYWDVVNEFKALMHTWSLGVEEHFYLVYPVLLLWLAARRVRLLPVLSVLAVFSLGLNWLPIAEYQKFYWMPFRFYELALGAVIAVMQFPPVTMSWPKPLLLAGLVALLAYKAPWLPANAGQPMAVVMSMGLMVHWGDSSNVADKILRSRVAVGLGLISFGLYMWHQPVLAFTRYYFAPELKPGRLLLICLLTLSLSVITYFAVEKPIRNRQLVGNRALLIGLVTAYVLLLAPALYIHYKSGVIRDVPELDITTEIAESDMHSKFNAGASAYDRPFDASGKAKILVIGNSFARDWVNVLLASEHADRLDVSYVENPFEHAEISARVTQADRIYYSLADVEDVAQLGLPIRKLTVLGVKSFGISNGRFYNHGKEGYCAQRTNLAPGTEATNELARKVWGDRYLDFVGRLTDARGMVPVFTPSCRFISQDTRHLTRPGAGYLAQVFEADIRSLIHE